MRQKKYEIFDDSFYKLAGEVTKVLEKNKDGTIQKEQVEELLDAEKKFKETILKYRQSTTIYKRFLQKICIENKNILSARPYFRETAVNFSKKITPAIKNENIDLIKTFDVNYQLIKFIRESWLGPFPKRAEQLFQRVHVARHKLIENNMPLAINRAKLFYRKTPRSHLTLLDLIGISAMGLASGVDKWCGPYTDSFKPMVIGRMIGNLIDAYSETTIHFFPRDRRILYKANSIRGRQGIQEIPELTRAVNNSFQQDKKEGKNVPEGELTVSELSSLMNAASIVSADATVNDEGFGIYHYTIDYAQDIENNTINKETVDQMVYMARQLPFLHRKVLKLKGVKL